MALFLEASIHLKLTLFLRLVWCAWNASTEMSRYTMSPLGNMVSTIYLEYLVVITSMASSYVKDMIKLYAYIQKLCPTRLRPCEVWQYIDMLIWYLLELLVNWWHMYLTHRITVLNDTNLYLYVHDMSSCRIEDRYSYLLKDTYRLGACFLNQGIRKYNTILR